MSKIKSFVRQEITLCIAFIAAVISCFFVKPDRGYLDYPDLRTLALLYCLMVVVAGLRRAGVFNRLSHILCGRAATVRAMAMVLVALSFFSAMLVTNDVALLTFVPFAVAVLGMAGKKRYLTRVVVLQAVAANLGSMLTPVGNPQNLYLYSHYNMSMGDFLLATGPIWALSAAAIGLLCLWLPREPLEVFLGEKPLLYKGEMWVYLGLFCVCLLTVVRVLEWYIMLGVLVALLLVYRRKMLLSADFYLLLTFVCFFVFSGNLGRIPAVDGFLRQILSGHELLVGAGLSQVISNVPAAILLSGFTDNGRALLLGVDIGGLGTPIASLASLIAMKLYSHAEGANPGKFMKLFLLLNFGLLAVLLAVAAIL